MGAGVLKVRFFCFVALLPGTSTRATGVVAAAGAALPLITPPKHSFWARSAHPGTLASVAEEAATRAGSLLPTVAKS